MNPDIRPLVNEIGRFEAEVQRLASDLVREVLQQQLERHASEFRRRLEPTSQSPIAAKPRATAKSKREPAREASVKAPVVQEQLPLEIQPAAPPQTAAIASPPVAAEQPAAPPVGGGKRAKWTRESVLAELENWMPKKGSTIDAAFMTRHGPPGLVAAAKRIFGRFDAALNVVALRMSKVASDDVPAR